MQIIINKVLDCYFAKIIYKQKIKLIIYYLYYYYLQIFANLNALDNFIIFKY